MTQASIHKDADVLDFTAAAARSPGEVIQHPSGLAGIVNGNVDLAIGDLGSCVVRGVAKVDKASGTVFTAGDRTEWNDTTNLAVAATFGTFELGDVTEDAPSGQLYVLVNLNTTKLT